MSVHTPASAIRALHAAAKLLKPCGGSIGIERIRTIQEAEQSAERGLTVRGAEEEVMRLASQLRAHGLRTGVYLGASGKLAKQMRWANSQHARVVLLYGPEEQQTCAMTV